MNGRVVMQHEAIKKIALVVFLLVGSVAWASTTWYVNGVSGSDTNSCTSASTACKTIGRAVSLASSGDSIKVAPATYTENLSIGINLRLMGSGADTTIIDGGGAGTVVTIPNSTAHVYLSKFTIRNGSSGGIVNQGVLTINSSSISGNTFYSRCTSCFFAFAAGISGGTLTINNSTVNGNVATERYCKSYCFTYSGGISGGRVTINNSTISGNSGKGGAVLTAKARISSSTIAGNYERGITGTPFGGSATLQNSIVANNSGGNCFITIISNGYNLSSDSTCNFSNTGDLNSTDPQLGPLQNNGGPTPTMALSSGSPAIDAGNPNGCTDSSGHLLKTDQRGMPRPDPEDTGGCDMGAYESQSD